MWAEVKSIELAQDGTHYLTFVAAEDGTSSTVALADK
jgi:hypothetical protein